MSQLTNEPGRTPQAREGERRLDAQLEDSFPASDPPALTRRGAQPVADDAAETEAEAACRNEMSDRLDEALEETFPASDPPAVTRHRPDCEPG